jgi:L-amino acid N-acyltransferase YncA
MELTMPIPTPEIREAAETDLPRILEITNQAIAHTTAVWSVTPATLEARLVWLRERTARGFPVLVAEHGGVVLGFASYGDFRPWEGYIHTVEHSVYVHPDARGRGVGRALLTALIAHASRSGRHVMVGGIEATNTASIALHKWAGFTEAGVLREVGRKFDRWLDLLFMQKVLPGGGPRT